MPYELHGYMQMELYLAGAFKEELKTLASTVDNDPRAFYAFLHMDHDMRDAARIRMILNLPFNLIY
jgi:uncharacterized protein YecE (DUF72 family)